MDNIYMKWIAIILCWFFLNELFAVQRERDVKESILFMAKQSGSIDANVSASYCEQVSVEVVPQCVLSCVWE